MIKAQIKCAIYTRKSSEEGLEQSFNSLAAQREACRAFILSQKHEGWTVLKEIYDDGGISGGTMERPALQRLLKDIQDGNVNTVVVYKVDRLTRSLTDFAKIIEIFDSHTVSFVSVTQQFNTTSSMGRLTLNVLLSFAQFEREITGERIRDKIAASKKKGMWMGGTVPLGYDCVKRQLVVNRQEAETVREIFRQYVRLGCLTKLRHRLKKKQTRSKIRTSLAGRQSGGAAYSRGALHHLLCNRIYLGDIVHGAQHFPGQHDGIVTPQLWNKVATRLNQNNKGHRSTGRQSTQSLLTGLLFDFSGVRFTPTHSRKHGKRYRYYTSQAVIQKLGSKPHTARYPAQEIESAVTAELRRFLRAPENFLREIKDGELRDAIARRLAGLTKDWPRLERAATDDFIRGVVSRVTLGQSKLWIGIRKENLVKYLRGSGSGKEKMEFRGNPELKLEAGFQITRRGSEIRICRPHEGTRPDSAVPSIVKAIARSREWYERIVHGELGTIEAIANNSGLTKRYVRKILQCAYLSPNVTQAILDGKHLPNLTLKRLLRRVSIDWREQERNLHTN